jgi:hypothetical protein
VPGVEEQLLGGWKLVSMTLIRPDGRSEPFGPDPVGTILYTSNHRMSATLGRRELPWVGAADEVSLEDARTLLHDFVAYIGEWVLDEPNDAVIHKIDYSSYGPLVGTDQVRYFRFDGNLLILRSPVEADSEQYGEIVWERA